MMDVGDMKNVRVEKDYYTCPRCGNKLEVLYRDHELAAVECIICGWQKDF